MYIYIYTEKNLKATIILTKISNMYFHDDVEKRIMSLKHFSE